MTIIVRRSFDVDPRDLAAASRAALDRPIEGDAELWIARPRAEAVTLGAFGRPVAGVDAPATLVRRGSGGAAVRVGEGSLWIALLLPRVDALVACDEARLLNRHVRPLLRALTKLGAPAHYFGRDWIAVQHRPAAWIGFAHDATNGRAVVECVVAASTRFDVEPRASFAGKEPGTIASLVGRDLGHEALADAVVDAWASAASRAAVDGGPLPRVDRDEGDDPRAEPPWAARVDEAIGVLGAGPDARGRFRVGGDLLASRDAIASLEDALPGARDDDVGPLVDAKLRAPGVALEGVRALASVRDAILAARATLGIRT